MKTLKKAVILCTLVGAMGGVSGQQSPEAPEALLRHVVLFKFKADTPEAKLREIEAAFLELPSKIPQIVHMEWGINNSPEGLNKGLTHGFLLTFRSEADRDAYLPHPDHKAFGEVAGPYIEDVVVLDYWAREKAAD
ncbi:Dabb family protein [Robiginitalea sp. M366]|uniref:Dabb family protein n=1 Tax=Robiginitalea aestuariiviva TaxID=3036903 RepID=UPI00240DACA0|nr:Dabb family protein [Robiginitalea aestuariiviva]MDG1572338.1 Dabb family protein [Robiginitalea aestuariiviva]